MMELQLVLTEINKLRTDMTAGQDTLRREMNAGFKDVNEKLAGVKQMAALNAQRVEDREKMCALDRETLQELQEKIVNLRVEDVNTKGEMKLKFSTSTLLLQLVVGVISMIPVAFALYAGVHRFLSNHTAN